MRLGNGKWESTTFNSRLQPTQIALGNVQNANNLLKLDYTYNTADNADNNGNVISQTITAPTVGAQAGFTATQTYTYDSLNRIKDATENSVTNGQSSSSQTWKQTFTYDRYGNRTFDEANTTTLPKNCGTSPSFTVCAADRKVVNPTANTSDNRLSSSDNYAYDYAGNTTADAQGRTFVYDAENKQTKVTNASGTLGEYVYDGDGKRVKKVSVAEETIFVYDAGGKLIAEYSTAVEAASTAKVNYTTNDHLGSPRIDTDEKGNVISRHDYQPFGEEIAQGRNTGLSYQADAVRKQFTGYERDDETDLDFAQARYFNSGFGRFSSPDDFLNDTRLEDPSSWNLYTYVRNNPLNLVDINGKKADVRVSYDEKTNTYNISVTAKFGVYNKYGNYSQKEIDKQIRTLKKQITGIYNIHGSLSNGSKVNVSTIVTVNQYSSEDDAIAAGQKGEVDNIVGLVKADFIGGGEPGVGSAPKAVGRGYRVEGEDFDRMLVATNHAGTNFTYAHEFGHLLDSEHQDEVQGLMNTYSHPKYANVMQYADFNVIFTKYLDKNNQSKLYQFSNSGKQRIWAETVRAETTHGSPFHMPSTINPR